MRASPGGVIQEPSSKSNDRSVVILDKVAELMRPPAGKPILCLVKPQFEVGRERVGKKGVVSDPALHQEVCDRIAAWIAQTQGWAVLGIVESPMTIRALLQWRDALDKDRKKQVHFPLDKKEVYRFPWAGSAF